MRELNAYMSNKNAGTVSDKLVNEGDINTIKNPFEKSLHVLSTYSPKQQVQKIS